MSVERSLSAFRFKSRFGQFGQSLCCYPEHLRQDPVVIWNLKPGMELRYCGFENEPPQCWPHRRWCVLSVSVRCPVNAALGSVALGISGSLNQKTAKVTFSQPRQKSESHTDHTSWPKLSYNLYGFLLYRLLEPTSTYGVTLAAGWPGWPVNFRCLLVSALLALRFTSLCHHAGY